MAALTDGNADMQDRLRDLAAAPLPPPPAVPAPEPGTDDPAGENDAPRDGAATQNPVADLERQYKRDNVSPAVPQLKPCCMQFFGMHIGW